VKVCFFGTKKICVNNNNNKNRPRFFTPWYCFFRTKKVRLFVICHQLSNLWDKVLDKNVSDKSVSDKSVSDKND
jgi:hypothetical protein